MIPNDIENTLFEALALMWSNSNKAEQVNVDAALAWLENHQDVGGCDYCNGLQPLSILNSNGRPEIIKDDGKYFIDSACSKFAINFCPICGTELREQGE